MADDKIFLDTNIIVYAYDISNEQKHEKAVEIVEKLWKSGLGVISTQVLQEFFFVVTKKIPHPLDTKEAKEIIQDFLKWDVVVSTGDGIIEAIDIHIGHKYSFWDSLIISSAIRGGASRLLSEDFSDGQVVNGVTITNPFVIK